MIQRFCWIGSFTTVKDNKLMDFVFLIQSFFKPCFITYQYWSIFLSVQRFTIFNHYFCTLTLQWRPVQHNGWRNSATALVDRHVGTIYTLCIPLCKVDQALGYFNHWHCFRDKSSFRNTDIFVWHPDPTTGQHKITTSPSMENKPDRIRSVVKTVLFVTRTITCVFCSTIEIMVSCKSRYTVNLMYTLATPWKTVQCYHLLYFIH